LVGTFWCWCWTCGRDGEIGVGVVVFYRGTKGCECDCRLDECDVKRKTLIRILMEV
jgi:hypothetical protein